MSIMRSSDIDSNNTTPYLHIKNEIMNRHMVNCARLPASRCVVSQTPSSSKISSRNNFRQIQNGPPTLSVRSEDLEKQTKDLPKVVSDPAIPTKAFLWIDKALRIIRFTLYLEAFFVFASICIVPGIKIFLSPRNWSHILLGIKTCTKILNSAKIKGSPPSSARK
jgi:hypothetical protein